MCYFTVSDDLCSCLLVTCVFVDVPYCVTPWHNVVVRLLDGTHIAMKKEDAESKVRSYTNKKYM